MEPFVHSKIQDQIATITFFHPQGNSMPSHQLNALSKTIQEAGNDENIKIIILKSEGEKAFCAGASFDELMAIEEAINGNAFFSGFAKVIKAMRNCPKFILVPVQGKTVGGGVGIAAAADYALATKNAEIKLSELAIGIGPFVIEPVVTRKIGLSGFTTLTLNPNLFYPAEWAKDNGLYQEVFEDFVTLENATLRLAENLKKYSLEAMSEIKKILWKDTENWDELLSKRAEISGKLVLSKETKLALDQFKKK